MTDRCTCVRCSTCQGFGDIDDPLDYSGRYPETCFDCDGTGLTEMCDWCLDQWEMEFEHNLDNTIGASQFH